MSRWLKFLENEDGPSSVEYAMLLGLIVLVTTSTLGGFGTGMHNIYVIISGAMPTPE